MSQTMKALITLRELILSGELPPSERVVEVALVERMGVSRTPVRAALARLADEGLLERIPSGGYIVREFTERDIQDAIELRGVLEGTAARFAAERGVSLLSLRRLHDCLTRVDRLLENSTLTDADIECYFELNESFHTQLVELAESYVIERTLTNVFALPFASADAFVMAQTQIGQAWKVFFVAQEQHKGIVEAIEDREGARAESLAREHARLSLQTLRTVIEHKEAIDVLPGLQLIYPTAL